VICLSVYNQTYGSNKVQVGAKWSLYSSDANRDGAIDGSDQGAVENENNAFVTGNPFTDLNGDSVVDVSDLEIVDNNNAFVAKFLLLGTTFNPIN
jgi:hypothetical protein